MLSGTVLQLSIIGFYQPLKLIVSTNTIIIHCFDLQKIYQDVEPTYLRVVEHMKRAILESFENAVTDELKENGILVSVQTHKFINEFRNQHKGNCIG